MSGLGFVYAGGAARGAYAAGVARFVFDALPSQLGRVPWPDVVTGTSVGALNGVFAAARDLDGVRRLSALWRNVRIDDIYQLRVRDVLATLRSTFRSSSAFSLLDARPLRGTVEALYPRAALRRSIDSGNCRAFVVSATELVTGYNALFFDSASPDLDLRPAPGARAYRTHIEVEHCLASAALPFLFPPLSVDGRLLVDGGLRQNTPLRPALRAGADRVLVLGLKLPTEDEGRVLGAQVTPNLVFLAGKTLNALMLDPIERDIRQAASVNKVLRWGAARYGPDFVEAIDRDLGIRPVHALHLHPTEDLGALAADVFRATPPLANRPVMTLLSIIADRANRDEADLLSYLLFDRAYTAEVEALGYRDAAARDAEIAALVGA